MPDSAMSNIPSHNDSDTNVSLSATSGDSQELFNYVVTKVEKISQALYVITNYLPIEEPFRRSVREKALLVIDQLYQVQVAESLTGLDQLVSNRLRELSSLLSIGVKAGLMSQMNFDVLYAEIKQLVSLSQERLRDTASAAPQLAESFFSTPLPSTSASRTSKETGSVNNVSAETDSKPEPIKAHKFIGDTEGSDSVDSNKPTNKTRRRHGTNHSKRQRQILGLFRNKEEISISDVQQVIEGCSQKTMQRELKRMVEEQLLDKQGKRRWSTYVLSEDVDLDMELGDD